MFHSRVSPDATYKSYWTNDFLVGDHSMLKLVKNLDNSEAESLWLVWVLMLASYL